MPILQCKYDCFDENSFSVTKLMSDLWADCHISCETGVSSKYGDNRLICQ